MLCVNRPLGCRELPDSEQHGSRQLAAPAMVRQLTNLVYRLSLQLATSPVHYRKAVKFRQYTTGYKIQYKYAAILPRNNRLTVLLSYFAMDSNVWPQKKLKMNSVENTGGRDAFCDCI